MNNKPIHYSDDLERAIGEALEAAGIAFHRPERLDFFLPDFGIYIEVKRYHSSRSNDQLASQDNIIFLQGKPTIHFFINYLLNKSKL